MNDLLKNALAIVTILSVIAGCSGGESFRLPTAPTAPQRPPQAPSGVSANAIPIVPGQTVAGVVTLADPTCGSPFTGEPPEPCQRFALAVPTSGALKIQLTTRGPYSFTLGIGSHRVWAATSLDVSVQAGLTYEISVALHGRINGTDSQAFELTTTLAPY